MAETFHGVPIPDDFWESWNDPNSSEVSGFRQGVWAALKIAPGSDLSVIEDDRLEALARTRDQIDQAAFEEQHRNEPWMQRRVAFREAMEEGRNGG